MPMMTGGFPWIFPLVGMGIVIVGGWAVISHLMNRHREGGERAVLPERPLDSARERYAQGRISKAEFERIVEDLLSTEPDDRLP